jgi:hypothetical protein
MLKMKQHLPPGRPSLFAHANLTPYPRPPPPLCQHNERHDGKTMPVRRTKFSKEEDKLSS